MGFAISALPALLDWRNRIMLGSSLSSQPHWPPTGTCGTTGIETVSIPSRVCVPQSVLPETVPIPSRVCVPLAFRCPAGVAGLTRKTLPHIAHRVNPTPTPILTPLCREPCAGL